MEEDSEIKYDQVELATFGDNNYDEIVKISHRVNDMIGSRANSKDLFQLHKYHVGGSYADFEVHFVHNYQELN